MHTVQEYFPVLTRTGIEDIAAITQLGERQTEDLKIPGSIPGRYIQPHHAPQPTKQRLGVNDKEIGVL